MAVAIKLKLSASHTSFQLISINDCEIESKYCDGSIRLAFGLASTFEGQ